MPDGVASGLHALLRLWLPARLRREHGLEMERVFLERVRADPPGPRRLRRWVAEAKDLAVTGVRLRWAARGKGGMMRGWTDDVRGAVRGLARTPGFLVFAVGTLGLGIGAAVTFSAFLDRIVLRPIDFPEADRLVGVWRSSGGGLMISPTQETLERVLGSDAFDAVAATRGEEVVLSGDAGPSSIWTARIDHGLPELAGLAPLIGRYFDDEELAGEGLPVVVLTEGAWERRYGRDPEVLGASITLDGNPHTVVGVAPDRLTSPMPGREDVELWLPLGNDAARRGLNVYARLAPGVTVEMAQERMDALDAGAAEAEASQWTTKLTPVATLLMGRFQSPLRAVGAAVALLLLISCLNTANLMLARGDARRGETAIRAALGAGRMRLGRELFVESAVVAALASTVGVALAMGTVAVVRSVRPEDLHVLDALRLDPLVVALALLAAAGTALSFGVLPLAHRLRTNPGRALGERSGTADGDAVRTRRWLLVGEVALSFALLATTVQLASSLWDLQRRDPGMAVDELVVADVSLPEWRFPDDASRAEVMERITEAARRLPGAGAVGLSSAAPTRPGIFFGKPEVEGAEPVEPSADVVFFGNAVAPGYFEAVGRAVVQGREFVQSDLDEGERAVVLGVSSAERYFPEGDAVGRRFRIGGDEWQTVVGVVEDAWITGGANDPGYPQMYVPARAGQANAVHVRTDDPEAMAGLLRDVVGSADPEIPAGGVSLVRSLYRDALARERMISVLLVAFSVAAGLLAAVGLYGVLAQVALRRVREFGIRISLGAERREIFALVLRGGVGPVIGGLVAGVALAWGGLRLLESGIVGLDGARPLPFALAAVLLAAAAAFAMSLPAERAARTDPMQALRGD